MKNIYTKLILITLLVSNYGFSQTVGDFAVIGLDSYTTSGSAGETDRFTLVAATDIAASYTLYITDRGWRNMSNDVVNVSTNEGTIQWTLPSSMSKGDIVELAITPGSSASATVTINGGSSSNVTVTGWTDDTASGSPIRQGGESLILYTGSVNAPTTFIYAFTSSSFEADNTLTTDVASKSENPSTLSGNKTNQVRFDDRTPVSGGTAGSEAGRLVFSNLSGNLLNKTNDPANWETSTTSLNISNDYFTGVLSTDDFDLNQSIRIYPNPTQGELTITTRNNVEINKIEVYNILGRKVKQGFDSINLNDLANGVYLAKIYDVHDNNVTKKILKQ